MIAKISSFVEIEITENDLDINKLDDKINKASLKAGQEIFKKSLDEINNYVINKKRDKDVAKIHSHKTGKLGTLVGDIKYRYTQVKEEINKEVSYYSPLKRVLNIQPHQQITDGLKIQGVLSSSNVSYRVASEKLSNRISHSTIRNSALEVGKNIKKQEEEYTGENVKSSLFKGQSSQAFIEADGIYIPMQGGKNKKSEVKLAICYSGRENRYKKGSSVQKHLKDKIVYGDICKSEDFIEKASVFFNYFCSLMSVLYILILGDGATWIKDFLSVYSRGVYQLDRFHLLRKLRSHFSRKKEIYDEIKKLIEENRIDDVLLKIQKTLLYFEEKIAEYEFKGGLEDRKDEHKSYRKRIDFYRRRIKKVKELISYIENNKEGINGIDAYKDIFEDCDLIIGSGGIENQVKNTIARRMKGQGKCWKNEGARAMVKILTSINNGWYSFEDYLNIFSLNRKPLELPKKLKEKIVISKGRKETYQMEQIYKGTIPCFAPSSSPTGYLKKEFSDIDYMDVLHI